MGKEGSVLHFHGNGSVRKGVAKFYLAEAFFDAKRFLAVDFSACFSADEGAVQVLYSRSPDKINNPCGNVYLSH